MRARLSHISAVLLLLYFGVIFHGVLFSTAGAFERDAFYHARYAQMLPERGLSRQFPWMQFTAWKDAFADKDFLYHVYLAPFCRDSVDPLPGAKWATLLLTLGGLALFYLILVRLRVPWPVFWLALLTVGSGLYVSRMLMVRSHVLSIVLMIAASYAIIKERTKTVLVIAFFYPWAYSFPLAMLITACGAAAGRFLFCERSWRILKIPALTAAGVTAGLIIHPYTPNSIKLIWELLNISVSRTAGVKLELGSEFMPIASNFFQSPESFLIAIRAIMVAIPGPVLALVAAAVLDFRLKRISIPARSVSGESAAAFGIATVWFVGLFLFSRLIEYFAPVAVLAVALATRDSIVTEQQPATRDKRLFAGMLAAILLIAGFNYLAIDQIAYPLVRSNRDQFTGLSHNEIETEKLWLRNRFFDGAANWMRTNLRGGECVINFHWDDFPELYYSDPQQYYIVGLDPTLMRLHYPEKSAALESMRTKQTPLDFAKLKTLFGSDYVVIRRYRATEYPELKDGTYKPVYADDLAVIYKID
jgi:hypothetical protein